MTWMRQPSWQGIALFSVRMEFWRSTARKLAEGVAKQEQLPSGARQGRNDFGKIGYGGPCPPPGKPHRYFFKLYALDTKPNLKAGATKADVERALKGHILGQAELMGRYGR